jgi:hypothetical protein
MLIEGWIASDEFLKRAAYFPPAPRRLFEIQGVGGDSRAFLNPPDAPCYNKQTDKFATEGLRLTPTLKAPIIPIGYSMGGDSVRKYLTRLSPQQRDLIGAAVTFGDPSMPPEGSLLGDRTGAGISGVYQPDWVRNRYYSYAIDGDWYPQARGLLPFLYQVLTRAELTMDFALWLFTQFPLQAMQELMGVKPSDDPLAGVLGPLAGFMTSGPAGVLGSLLNPTQIFMLLPQLVQLMFDAVSFLATNAHGKYGDPAVRNWDGLTGVDHAAKVLRDKFPNGGTVLLFPGTWSQWNQLFQFDVAIRLP